MPLPPTTTICAPGSSSAAIGDRHRGIRQRGNDVGALVDVLGPVADLDLDIVFRRHLAAELLAVLAGRAEHLQLLDRAHAGEGLHVGARHPAGAEDADHFGILIGQIFDANAAVGADPHVLEVAVIEEGQKLAVLDRGEQDQPAEQARAACSISPR